MLTKVLTNNFSLISTQPIEGYSYTFDVEYFIYDKAPYEESRYYNHKYISYRPNGNKTTIYVKQAKNIEDFFNNLVHLSDDNCPTTAYIKKIKLPLQEYLVRLCKHYTISSSRTKILYNLDDLNKDIKDSSIVIYKHPSKSSTVITITPFEHLLRQAIKIHLVGAYENPDINIDKILQLMNKPIEVGPNYNLLHYTTLLLCS